MEHSGTFHIFSQESSWKKKQRDFFFLSDLGVNNHNAKQLLKHFIAHEPLQTYGFTYYVNKHGWFWNQAAGSYGTKLEWTFSNLNPNKGDSSDSRVKFIIIASGQACANCVHWNKNHMHLEDVSLLGVDIRSLKIIPRTAQQLSCFKVRGPSHLRDTECSTTAPRADPPSCSEIRHLPLHIVSRILSYWGKWGESSRIRCFQIRVIRTSTFCPCLTSSSLPSDVYFTYSKLCDSAGWWDG